MKWNFTIEKDFTCFGIGFAIHGLFKKDENILIIMPLLFWHIKIFQYSRNSILYNHTGIKDINY